MKRISLLSAYRFEKRQPRKYHIRLPARGECGLAVNSRELQISSTGGTAAALSKSQLGDLAKGIVNSAYLRNQEKESDNFAYDFLKKRNINPSELVSSFEKLAKLTAGREASLFDSHTHSEERAQNINERIAAHVDAIRCRV